MDVHHLKIFFEACKEKSFTKAAKNLFISQSAVSIQIKKLETKLGIQLIERNSKNFRLTFAGKELYRMSKDVFDKILRVEKEMEKISHYGKGKICIGATHNIGEPVLPRIMVEFKKNNPEIEFDLYIKNRESLVRHLKEGTVDIALMEEYFIEDICDIKSGVRLVKAEHKKGKIPFISAVDNNNGITEFIENINNSFDKNILSVNYNGSVVETLYHPYESIFSDDVKRVAFADKSQNNEYALLFLKQMIIQQKSKYQYGYKFNGKRMARQKIILPSKNNVTPDYDFMKKYMMIQEILKIKEILEFY